VFGIFPCGPSSVQSVACGSPVAGFAKTAGVSRSVAVTIRHPSSATRANSTAPRRRPMCRVVPTGAPFGGTKSLNRNPTAVSIRLCAGITRTGSVGCGGIPSEAHLPAAKKAHHQYLIPPQAGYSRFLQLAWNTVIRYPLWYPLAGRQHWRYFSWERRSGKGCGCFRANQPGATAP
jgi:hypothetical protein